VRGAVGFCSWSRRRIGAAKLQSQLNLNRARDIPVGAEELGDRGTCYLLRAGEASDRRIEVAEVRRVGEVHQGDVGRDCEAGSADCCERADRCQRIDREDCRRRIR